MKDWTMTEIRELEKIWMLPDVEIAKKLQRSVLSIRGKRFELGLKKPIGRYYYEKD